MGETWLVHHDTDNQAGHAGSGMGNSDGEGHMICFVDYTGTHITGGNTEP